MPFHRPLTSQRSRGTMRDALRPPAHRRAPEPEPHPPAGTTRRETAEPNHFPTLRVGRSLPSLRRGFAPLDKKMLPLPRPRFSGQLSPVGQPPHAAGLTATGPAAPTPTTYTTPTEPVDAPWLQRLSRFGHQLDTDLIARTKIVSARRLLGLRPLPAPVKNIATTCEQGSATREPVVRSGSTFPGHVDPPPTEHTHAGSDAQRGRPDVALGHAAEPCGTFRRMPEGDVGDTGIEKDRRELLSLFESRRDAGHILEVTEGDIASPNVVDRAPLLWPAPRAETLAQQNRPAASSTYRGSSKHLQSLEAAERAQRDEERLLHPGGNPGANGWFL